MHSERQTWAEAHFRAHEPAVRRYVRRRCDPANVDDVVSEVFMTLWRRRENAPDEPLFWLLAVAHRVIATHRRSQQRWDALQLRATAAAMEGTTAHDQSVADVAAVRAALATLSHADQEVIALIAWDELSVSASAEVIPCTPAAFRMRLSRARRRLETALQEGDGPSPNAEYRIPDRNTTP